MGACAINGGLPAQRNHLPLTTILREVYHTARARQRHDPNDPELPLPLDKVRPIHEVVRVDYFIPGCPPSGPIWKVLTDLLAGREPGTGPRPDALRLNDAMKSHATPAQRFAKKPALRVFAPWLEQEDP
jgi:coenzyme F420-reducing hydrogenase gamma subunit